MVLRQVTPLSVCCLLLVPMLCAAGVTVLDRFEIVDQNDFSSLTLMTDGTFVYKSRGSSCWTWSEYSGNWYLHKNRLELNYTLTHFDTRTAILTQEKRGDPARVTVEVVDTDGLPLRDVRVTFNHGADYRRTGADGSVMFEYADLPTMFAF